MPLNEVAPSGARSPRKLMVTVAAILILGGSAVGVYFAVQGTGSSGDVELRLTRAGKIVSYKRYSPPQTLPEIRFENGKGKPLTLADFRGKVVLLNIWATWCSPCREEMPALDKLQATLGGLDFEVVALSIDQGGVTAVRKFFGKIGIRTLALYVDPSGQASSTLGAVGVPTTLMIDRAGRELWRVVGPVQWDKPEAIETVRGIIGAPSKKGAYGFNG